VRTPTFDRIAREGARFDRAFVQAPSCTPSRAAILTGQAPHRLEEGSQLWGFLPSRFAVYPDLLEAAGYHVGFTRKGWGPGNVEGGGRTRNPAGPAYPDFETFYRERPAGRPFVFWFGSHDPHRPYEARSGAAARVRADRAAIPAFLPDTPEVRGDIADYYAEVERFDREVADILKRLEAAGELDRTLVVMTSDNGMPFPRAKANVYDGGTHVPLAVRWPGRVQRGLVVDAFVSLTDLAPTFLEAAGLPRLEVMTGRSILALAGGAREPDRDRVFMERERHANVRKGNGSYPMRAVRTADHLYVSNLRPERWPAGDPETVFSVGPYGDIDDGPSKRLLLDRRDDPLIGPFFRLAVAKRPPEELYDLLGDPSQLKNVADDAGQAGALAALRASLDAWMRKTGDPRATQDDDRWDQYPYFGGPAAREPVRPVPERAPR
jgi:arylsulfatase A-like enzyme